MPTGRSPQQRTQNYQRCILAPVVSRQFDVKSPTSAIATACSYPFQNHSSIRPIRRLHRKAQDTEQRTLV